MLSIIPEFPAIGDASFNSKAYAFGTHMVDTFVDEANTLATDVNTDAVAAVAAKVLATAEAVNAHNEATAAAASALASSALVWVSGTTYATTGAGSVVYSPINYLCYRRIVAGAGTTDPSLDPTNWAEIAPSPVSDVVVVTATGTWTCPAGVTRAKVTVVGGGASSTCCSTRVGLGGGGGGTAIKTLTVTPGTVYTCTIGAGGAAPTGADTNSAAGGTSSFAGSGISTVSATGGNAALYTELWAGGGMGSGGDINMPGGGVFTMPGTGASRCPAMGGDSSMGGVTRFGLDATGYGCGGGGSLENSSQGYAGKAGVIVIEY